MLLSETAADIPALVTQLGPPRLPALCAERHRSHSHRYQAPRAYHKLLQAPCNRRYCRQLICFSAPTLAKSPTESATSTPGVHREADMSSERRDMKQSVSSRSSRLGSIRVHRLWTPR